MFANTASKSRSVLACNTLSCTPSLSANACKTLVEVSATLGLVGLTSNAMLVAVGTNSCSKLQPLRLDLRIQSRHSGDVATWSRKAGDKSKLDWIACYFEDDWNSRSCRFRCKCRGRATGCGNDGHLPTNQITCQRRQSIILAFCPAVIDPYVAAPQRSRSRLGPRRKRANELPTSQATPLPRNPITGIAVCCARAGNGQPYAEPHKSVMNSRRFISAPSQGPSIVSTQTSPLIGLKPATKTIAAAHQPMSQLGHQRRFSDVRSLSA